MPVGLVKANSLYYVHTDHLGTPRTITNNANTTVWKWNNTDPFGGNLPTTQTIVYNKRFPGQYFDNESKLHYNYYRTYNPLTGRYIQSDPLGLAAGFNTYSYVGSNPLGTVDPLGLDTSLVIIKDSSGINHAAISINDFVYSIYPQTMFAVYKDNISGLTIESSKDFLKKYKTLRVKLYQLKLDDLEEKHILNTISNIDSNYSVFANNCSQYVGNVLEASGFKNQGYDFAPTHLEYDLFLSGKYNYKYKTRQGIITESKVGNAIGIKNGKLIYENTKK